METPSIIHFDVKDPKNIMNLFINIHFLPFSLVLPSYSVLFTQARTNVCRKLTRYCSRVGELTDISPHFTSPPFLQGLPPRRSACFDKISFYAKPSSGRAGVMLGGANPHAVSYYD